MCLCGSTLPVICRCGFMESILFMPFPTWSVPEGWFRPLVRRWAIRRSILKRGISRWPVKDLTIRIHSTVRRRVTRIIYVRWPDGPNPSCSRTGSIGMWSGSLSNIMPSMRKGSSSAMRRICLCRTTRIMRTLRACSLMNIIIRSTHRI